MSHLQGDGRRQHVSRMFSRIASRYDLMNRLMSLGQDMRLRCLAVRRLEVPPAATVLDNGSGSGDLAAEVLRSQPGCRVVACDLTPAMLAVSQRRFPRLPMLRVIADAQALPFPAAVFQRAVCGYLLRNVHDTDRCLGEMQRVLSSGGRMVSLDTTPLQASLFSPLVGFYLNRIIPLLGRLIAGNAEAYVYLPESTASFMPAEGLAVAMRSAGLRNVTFSRHLLGSHALHRGDKP